MNSRRCSESPADECNPQPAPWQNGPGQPESPGREYRVHRERLLLQQVNTRGSEIHLHPDKTEMQRCLRHFLHRYDRRSVVIFPADDDPCIHISGFHGLWQQGADPLFSDLRPGRCSPFDGGLRFRSTSRGDQQEN